MTVSLWRQLVAVPSAQVVADETWLLAVLSRTEQHLPQPITGLCTGPRRSKPQGPAMPVKPLFHAYYTNVTDAHECFILWGNIAFFFLARKSVYDSRHFDWCHFKYFAPASACYVSGGKSAPPSSAALIYSCKGWYKGEIEGNSMQALWE